MEKVVNEALSLILEDWLKSSGKTFDLMTEDIVFTKNVFCTCLDEHEVKYQMLDNRLIIGNKKICIYNRMK